MRVVASARMYGSCSGIVGNVRGVGKSSAAANGPTLSGLPTGPVITGSGAGGGT